MQTSQFVPTKKRIHQSSRFISFLTVGINTGTLKQTAAMNIMPLKIPENHREILEVIDLLTA